MSTRSLLFVGLTLLGAHQMLWAVLALPEVVVLVHQANQLPSFAGEAYDQAIEAIVFQVLSILCRFVVALVLVYKAPRLAEGLVGRRERLVSDAAQSDAGSPPQKPRSTPT